MFSKFFLFSMLAVSLNIFSITWNLPPESLSSTNNIKEFQVDVNSSGTGISVWRNKNSSLQSAYSLDYGATWSSIIDILGTNKIFSDPSVAINSSGKIIVVYKGSDNKHFRILEIHSLDSGATWSEPIFLSEEGQRAENPHVIMKQDKAIVVWKRMNGRHYIIQETHLSNAGINWSEPTSLSESGQSAEKPLVVMNSLDNAVVTWQRRDGRHFRIQTIISGDGGNTWSSLNTLSEEGQSAINPTLAINSSGMVVAAWQRKDGVHDRVQITTSLDSGATFSTVATLSEAGQAAKNANVAIDPSNNIVVTWSRINGNNFMIQAVNSLDAGATFSSIADLSETGQNANYPKVVFDNSGNVVVVWERMDGSYSRIQSTYSSDYGATWQTVTTISDSGKSSYNPKIILDTASGNGFAIWRRRDEFYNILKKANFSN